MIFKSVRQAISAISRDAKRTERKMRRGVKKAARATIPVVRKNIPRAFGELEKSLHVEDLDEGSSIVVDAPYAAAVEVGSRPHTPPLEPLIRWAKLRALQGQTKTGRVKKVNLAREKNLQRGRRRLQAQRVASQLREMEIKGKRGQYGRHSDVGAIVAIARGIQRAISRAGTKPAWYMRQAVPTAEAKLKQYADEAIESATRETPSE